MRKDQTLASVFVQHITTLQVFIWLQISTQQTENDKMMKKRGKIMPKEAFEKHICVSRLYMYQQKVLQQVLGQIHDP